MTHIQVSPELGSRSHKNKNTLPVLVYGGSSMSTSGYAIGKQLIDRVARLGVSVPPAAFDFLTISLAVTAADTFVVRRSTDDGWCRQLDLDIAVSNPSSWKSVKSDLESALHFLTDDMWNLSFSHGGSLPPLPFNSSKGRRLIPLEGTDCACLFSGGLDSTIGVLDLLARGSRPLLVSHAYRGDRQVQQMVRDKLPMALPQFAANAHPASPTPNEVSMRSRSLNFIAFGALCACALTRGNGRRRNDRTTLFIPENGYISLNPPLTPRRIGALSTRTTHPHFLQLIQSILDEIGLGVALSNPYQFLTKGEMLMGCGNQDSLKRLARLTVSCGKWKRTGQQCGRCVPCIIRRAAFLKAGHKDQTAYREASLSAVLRNEDARDDLVAMAIAAERVNNGVLATENFARWVGLAGPLPSDTVARHNYVDVARRGLEEASSLLTAHGITA